MVAVSVSLYSNSEVNTFDYGVEYQVSSIKYQVPEFAEHFLDT
jgi:hypothetical protein